MSHGNVHDFFTQACLRRSRYTRFHDVNRSLVTLAVLTACGALLAQTNANITKVQNRLKAEGFYFGNPTGLLDSETTAALTQYQIRHGLTVTRKLDTPTAKELNASTAKTQSTPAALSGNWQRLPSGEMQFVQQPTSPTPSPATRSTLARSLPPPLAPAEAPTASASVAENPHPPTAAPAANLDQPRSSVFSDTVNQTVRDYVEAFVQAGLTRPPASELKFFAGRVDYFGAPNVPRQQIERDLVRYNQKWPHRTFWIDGDIQVQEHSGDEIQLLFPLRYDLRNGSRHASGKLLKSLTLLKTSNDEMQIVAVNEWKP
jgi:peptidoglycan hydrolase-like protein with peptidoglycan-binding domain